MDDSSLVQRVENVLEEYGALFGGTEHLNLSGDIEVAQKALKDLEDQSLTSAQLGLKDSIGELTSAERLAAYDLFQTEVDIKRKQQISDLSELNSLDGTSDPATSNQMKSRLEILAEERDYKRRRQSYKGGKAGSSKRSYSEVIRDVIETQSEMLRTMTSVNRKIIKKEKDS